MRGTSGNRSAMTDRPIYSGRKSWPHCDTQCASSIANRAIWARPSKREAARRQQPLRRDIEQIEIAGEQPLLDRGGFVEDQRGIQHRGLDAGLEQARDLVAHQRDQRRDHDAAALAQQRRQLIAQRLAAAGRHQHQAIAAVGDMADDRFLRAAKAGQAEHGIQHGERVGGDAGLAVARRERYWKRACGVVCDPSAQISTGSPSAAPDLSRDSRVSLSLPRVKASITPANRNASATLKAGILRRAAASSAWRSSSGEQP